MYFRRDYGIADCFGIIDYGLQTTDYSFLTKLIQTKPIFGLGFFWVRLVSDK